MGVLLLLLLLLLPLKLLQFSSCCWRCIHRECDTKQYFCIELSLLRARLACHEWRSSSRTKDTREIATTIAVCLCTRCARANGPAVRLAKAYVISPLGQMTVGCGVESASVSIHSELINQRFWVSVTLSRDASWQVHPPWTKHPSLPWSNDSLMDCI